MPVAQDPAAKREGKDGMKTTEANFLCGKICGQSGALTALLVPTILLSLGTRVFVHTR